MLNKQTLKKVEVVAQREGERGLLSFLRFGFSLLLVFPTASCCLIRGIDSELNDESGLKVVGSRLLNGHDEWTMRKTTRGNLESWGLDL